jgi:YgiT-type zinc finger domain-containing protein
MTCDICGTQGTRLRHISRCYGKGKDLLVIENVPVISCLHCGQSYLDAGTLHEIDRIQRKRMSVAVTRPVAVVVFPQAGTQ